MLLVAEQGPRRGSLPGLPQVGPGRGHHRRGDRRRHAARPGPRRGGRRDPEPRAGRRGARSTTARIPTPPRATRRMEAPAVRAARTCAADLAALLASPDLCSQALDLGAVRLHGAHQHHRRARAATRPSCASRRPARRWPWRSTATAATAHLSPREGARLAVAECCRNLSVRGRAAGGRHQLPELRQPGAARDHGAARRGHRGHGRGLPVLRDAHHRRQREPLQRDARRRRSTPRRCWASWA